MEEATTLELQPLTPTVGAIAHGTDVRVPLAPDASKAIRAAVLEHGVVFFRDQALSREELLVFMENFGTPCMDPFAAIVHPVPAEQTIVEFPTLGYGRATSLWHIDSSLAAEPASFIALRALEAPSSGGDTCWASAIAAYETLSEPLRHLIGGLHAVNHYRENRVMQKSLIAGDRPQGPR